ncbi:MAG: DNA adenine methylase, partial [Bacilli bacterium]|nr:DNA adenine methylase [Bacilli bacterium]
MAKPILKWAGGKRQILGQIKQLMPANYNNYYEPFIGGAALLLDLLPSNAVINDVNHELLSIYRCLQNEELYNLFIDKLDVHA